MNKVDIIIAAIEKYCRTEKKGIYWRDFIKKITIEDVIKIDNSIAGTKEKVFKSAITKFNLDLMKIERYIMREYHFNK